jgi:hypothetical protein
VPLHDRLDVDAQRCDVSRMSSISSTMDVSVPQEALWCNHGVHWVAAALVCEEVRHHVGTPDADQGFVQLLPRGVRSRHHP